ncbi:MAG TPA: polysaccharide biosynthesis C-terminal domain-containing protein [Solirubrobacterales bacterium]
MPAADRPEPGSAPPARASYRAGFFFGVLSFFGTAVLGLVSTIVTSRLYGVEIIGEYALVFAPVAALNLLSSVKEQKALIKEITGLPPRHPRVTQLFAVVFGFSWALSVVVGVLVAGVCWFAFNGPLHAPELLPPVYVSIAGYVVVSNTNWNLDAVFSAFVAGRQLFWVRLHETVAIVVIAVAVGIAWHSVWGLVIATIGAAATSLVHRAVAVRAFVRPRLTRSELRAGLDVLPELLRFGLKATPGQIAQGASQQGGVWALGVVASTSVVGAYSRALSLPQRLQQASLRITEVLYPTLVGRHSEGDGHGFDRALIDSVRYEVVGMLLIAAVLGGAAHSVLAIFGPGFGQAAPALVLLSLFPAMASITVAQTQALWAINRPGLTSVVALARLAVTIGLLFALTPSLGVSGPAIALLAGYVVVIVLSGIAVRPALRRPLRATWPIRERLALVVAYAAGFAAARGMEKVTPSIAGVIACAAAGALAYVAAFLLLGGLNRRDRHRLTELLTRVGGRVGRQPASSAKLGQSARSISGKARARASTSSR